VGLLSTFRTLIFLIGALLIFGAYLLVPFVTKEGRGTPDAAITLLLIAPSALSAYLVAGEAHPFFRDSTKYLRFLVGVASLTPIAASLAYLVMDSVYELRIVWLSLALICFVVEWAVVRAHDASKRAFKQVVALAPDTIAGRAYIDDDADLLRTVTSALGLDATCGLIGVDRGTLLEALSPDRGGPSRPMRRRLRQVAEGARTTDDLHIGEPKL